MYTIGQRLESLKTLRHHLNSLDFVPLQHSAYLHNKWFIPEFVNTAITNISNNFLDENLLQAFCNKYNLQNFLAQGKTIGIIMSGNIPLVGFHDFLCCFLCGFKMKIKLSSKDKILFKVIVDFLIQHYPILKQEIIITDTLVKNCDAYLTMGNNTSSGLFEQYFKKYPSLIRANKTSVAVLQGNETLAELKLLADDIQMYFGLGCRSVTKIFVPEKYDFNLFFEALQKYSFLKEYKIYRDNYDYNLTLIILNKHKYLPHDVLILRETKDIFSPITQLYYSYYKDYKQTLTDLKQDKQIQCIVSRDDIFYGQSQSPQLENFPDDKNIIEFLKAL